MGPVASLTGSVVGGGARRVPESELATLIIFERTSFFV